MGSLFLIIIPVRSHELKLRLLEHEIYTSWAMPVQPPEEDNETSMLRTMKKAKTIESEKQLRQSQIPGMLVKDVPLPAAKENIMAYTIFTKDGNFLMQLTRDTMKLVLADNLDLVSLRSVQSHGGRHGSMSAGSDDSDTIDTNHPPKRHKSTESMNTRITDLIDSKFLEKHMEDVLTHFSLLSASWETSIDEKFSIICFSVNGERADGIVSHLHALGVGKKFSSTISVCATSVYTEQEQQKRQTLEEIFSEEKGMRNKFVQSIKARLTVAQVVQNVKANAELTFDFLVMLIVAGIIAALGLLESSSVNLIASMLVSPLMGPIMAFTFGAVIRDWPLIKQGLYAELCGLSICLAIGLTFGIFLEAKPINGPWANVDRWPTAEMYGRCQYQSLLVGAGVAIPSGAGVALSILAGNAGSLVGVAISASLLPPAVNCGIFYGLAMVLSIRESTAGRNPFSIPCHMVHAANMSKDMDASAELRNHNKTYCDNILREYAAMGTISLCLTLMNIALIILTSMIVLKIKEVAPYTTRTAFERFWKHDVKQARDYNKTHVGDDTLITDLADDPRLLDEVQDDYVFNQIKNRTMYREENVVTRVKEAKSKAVVGSGVVLKGK